MLLGRRFPFLILLLLGVVGLVLISVIIAGTAGLPRTSPSSSAFTFHGSTLVQLPDCSIVSLSWHDAAGGSVGFSVGADNPAGTGPGCATGGVHETGNTSGCPPTVCWIGGPFVYQVGSGGAVTFLANQGTYFFAERQLANVSNFSQDPLNVSFHYTLPLVPQSAIVPGRLAIVGVAIGAAGLGVLVVYPRHRGHSPEDD